MLRDDTFDFMQPGLNRNIHINSVGFGKMYSMFCLNVCPESSKNEKVVLKSIYLDIFTHMSPLWNACFPTAECQPTIWNLWRRIWLKRSFLRCSDNFYDESNTPNDW